MSMIDSEAHLNSLSPTHQISHSHRKSPPRVMTVTGFLFEPDQTHPQTINVHVDQLQQTLKLDSNAIFQGKTKSSVLTSGKGDKAHQLLQLFYSPDAMRLQKEDHLNKAMQKLAYGDCVNVAKKAKRRLCGPFLVLKFSTADPDSYSSMNEEDLRTLSDSILFFLETI
ncbi:hypothetical protein EW145_g6554 [Phellinidium pouzarii]|uniref:Uncharacterized protein n=1 Tax=Phellinidium pouzarii TaxID=167371 RepID=A0A4S4KXE0_9AGAM|nr:hypothetical protein EW145_g6554 [Phellinidium pouzarii]